MGKWFDVEIPLRFQVEAPSSWDEDQVHEAISCEIRDKRIVVTLAGRLKADPESLEEPEIEVNESHEVCGECGDHLIDGVCIFCEARREAGQTPDDPAEPEEQEAQ